MELFRYVKDSSDSWDCLVQYADLPKESIVGKGHDLSYLGYSMEIITACKRGTINKPKFNLKSYTSTCVHNDKLDDLAKQKKELSLIDYTDLEKGQSCPKGCYYERENKEEILESEKIIKSITLEDYYTKIKQKAGTYWRKYGVDILKLLEYAEQGYVKAIDKLKVISQKDKLLSEFLRDNVG